MKYLKQAPDVSEAGTVELTKQVIDILVEDVKENGEAAVRKYSERFDDWSPESFRVRDEEVAAAADEVPGDFKESIAFAQEQVRNFARAQRETLRDLEIESQPGVVLGHRHIPVGSVGAYVPGGRYTLIASSYNSVIPAKVAGVERVVVCTPPADGRVPPALLYSAHMAGADEIYALGGIQAVAAMAYGALPDLEPVDMLARLREYGSLFVGEETTVAYGDKVSGLNHILPTLRAARYTGGLWVGKYLKTVTYQHMSREGSIMMARHCKTVADAEGMAAHARTATIRLERYRTEEAGT